MARGKTNRKFGRNDLKCKIYKETHRREKNKICKAEKLTKRLAKAKIRKINKV
jgi:hypothetical protein